MDPTMAGRVRQKIKHLAADPYAAGSVKKLSGREGYRLRVGDVRVIFEIDDAKKVIVVMRVGYRGGIYD